jgi:hypothetical protein
MLWELNDVVKKYRVNCGVEIELLLFMSQHWRVLWTIKKAAVLLMKTNLPL